DFGEAVTTKADLQKYIDSLEDFLNDNLDKYGKTQPANLTAAVDHAKVVLGDTNATSKDYAAAYAMVKAVKAKLKDWSNDELKALVKDWQGVYDTNNILNEELNDNIYTEKTFESFREAFEQADRYIDSGDDGGITDAYVELEEAAGALKKLTAITKSDFRTALANYEQLELSMRNYESWRRGTISATPKTGEADDKEAAKIADKKAVVTAADLRNMVYGTSEGTFKYLEKGKWSTLTFTSELIGADWDGRTADLKTDIKKVGDDFAALKGVVSTTDTTIKAAYDAAVEAVEVYKSWTPDSYRSGSKGACATLLTKYHNQLVESFNSDDIKQLISGFDGTADAKATIDIAANSAEIEDVTFTYTKSTHKLVADKEFYIVKVKATGLIDAVPGELDEDTDFYATKDAAVTAISGDESLTYQRIAKNTDILQYIGFENPITQADKDALIAAAEAALKASIQKMSGDGTAWVKEAAFSSDYEKEGTDTTVFDAVAGTGDVTIYKIKKLDAGNGDADVVTAHNALYEELVANDAAYDAANALTPNATSDVDKSLAKALAQYTIYLNTVFTGTSANTTAAEAIMGINGAEGLADGKTFTKVTGGTAEWTLIWRQLAYALEDKYPVPVAGTTYTLKMLEKLVQDAYTLCDETGDAELFSTPYADVVEARQAANTFIKVAKATTGYKDGDELKDTELLEEFNAAAKRTDTTGSTDTTDDDVLNEVTVELMYKELEKDYKVLNNWYNDFKYSFEKVKNDLADAAIALEKGDLSGDALAKAVEQCAYDLSVIEVSDVSGDILAATNVAFDDERVFQGVNRLKTDDEVANDQSTKEENLVASYEALVKAVAEAAKGDSDKGYDLDNSGGNPDMDDLQFMFDNFVLKQVYDAKLDFNNDKIVDMDDLTLFFNTVILG
ncbi:MAG: hypothetical protein ACI4JY_00615, partial [Oscillospiraceae bacterium]